MIVKMRTYKKRLVLKLTTQKNLSPKISTDAGFNLSEKDKEKKKIDELSETYKSRVPFPSVLEADSSHKKQGAHNEELMKLFKQVYINLSLFNVILYVLTYAKFLKKLCIQKYVANHKENYAV